MLHALNSAIQSHKDSYEDYFEKAKFILALRISFFLSVSVLILSLVFLFYFGHTAFIFGFIAFVSFFLTLIKIVFTGQYKLFTTIYIVIGVFLCQYTLFMFPEQPHIADSLWMVIAIILAFMLLDKSIAFIIAFLNIFSVSLFYTLNSGSQIKILKESSTEQSIGIGINVFICLIIISYLIYQKTKTTTFARMQIKETESQLMHQLYTIHKQNEEKTVLIKEIHHRVKNNLQVITSLLRLQSHELTNAEAIDKFNDTTNRVLAMAKIHEKMYQSERLSHINMKDYFTNLAIDLKDSIQLEQEIQMNIHCEIQEINLKAIVPIAIIINELLSNSFKHAFNGCDSPSVTIKFEENTDKTLSLTYADSGCWKIAEKQDSFGFELIKLMTEQLNGQLNFDMEHSTYSFRFETAKW